MCFSGNPQECVPQTASAISEALMHIDVNVAGGAHTEAQAQLDVAATDAETECVAATEAATDCIAAPSVHAPAPGGEETAADHTLQHSAILCNTPQHTATHCNTPQHTATHCNTETAADHSDLVVTSESSPAVAQLHLWSAAHSSAAAQAQGLWLGEGDLTRSNMPAQQNAAAGADAEAARRMLFMLPVADTATAAPGHDDWPESAEAMSHM